MLESDTEFADAVLRYLRDTNQQVKVKYRLAFDGDVVMFIQPSQAAKKKQAAHARRRAWEKRQRKAGKLRGLFG